MSTLKAVRGTRDLLPPETALWNRVEATARAVFARYGFGEIRTPIFEDTQLFVRGVGEETDVVSKEMYTWEDGERFDKEALKDAWRRKYPDVSIQFENGIPGGRLVVEPNEEEHDDSLLPFEERRSKYTVELVDFAERLDLSLIRSLREAQSPHRFYSFSQRLVVASPTGRKPDEVIEDVKIEYVSGQFVKSSQSLTLRPENTAGVVRAYIEHKLGDTGMLQKLFYIGPQFRRERPQRGRYRQFWQIGAEVLGPVPSGAESAIRDAEVLEMLATLLDELGIPRASEANGNTGWKLALNSVGSATDRPRYIAALREALQPVKATLCDDCQRRADTNPLRVLDCKVPEDQPIIDALPKIADYLDEASTAHFAQVREALDACGVAYTVEPRLVRGLDYYTRTTFEFTAVSGLGTQNALLGGGRYDGLSEMLGGPKAPGIGFAIGEDRLILTLQALSATEAHVEKLDAYIAPMGAGQNAAALALARELRADGLSIEVGDGTFRLKKSFELADKLARRIVILGEDEVSGGVLTVKTFATGEQTKHERALLAPALRER